MVGHDGYTRYTVRIPDALYERVKAAAGEKSVNAEIVSALQEKYPPAVSEAFIASVLRALKGADGRERVELIFSANAILRALNADGHFENIAGEANFVPWDT